MSSQPSDCIVCCIVSARSRTLFMDVCSTELVLCVFAQSTVSDLTVHQLSKEELVSSTITVDSYNTGCMHDGGTRGVNVYSQELRRSRILSKNAEKAKKELEEISKGLIDTQHMYTFILFI